MLTLGCSGVEALVVVFFGVDYYFVRTFVFAHSESVDPVNRKLAMLCKVQGTLLQSDQVLVSNNQDAVLLETIPIELLNLTTVENLTFVAYNLAHLQVLVEKVQSVVARNLVEVFHIKYYSN